MLTFRFSLDLGDTLAPLLKVMLPTYYKLFSIGVGLDLD